MNKRLISALNRNGHQIGYQISEARPYMNANVFHVTLMHFKTLRLNRLQSY